MSGPSRPAGLDELQRFRSTVRLMELQMDSPHPDLKKVLTHAEELSCVFLYTAQGRALRIQLLQDFDKAIAICSRAAKFLPEEQPAWDEAIKDLQVLADAAREDSHAAAAQAAAAAADSGVAAPVAVPATGEGAATVAAAAAAPGLGAPVVSPSTAPPAVATYAAQASAGVHSQASAGEALQHPTPAQAWQGERVWLKRHLHDADDDDDDDAELPHLDAFWLQQLRSRQQQLLLLLLHQL